MEGWTEPKQLSDGSKRHQTCESGSATLLQKFPLPHPLPCLHPSSAHARGTQKCPHGITSGREQPKSSSIFSNTLPPISYGVHPPLTSRTEDGGNHCPASPPRARGPGSHRSSHGVNGAGHLPQPKRSVPSAPMAGGSLNPGGKDLALHLSHPAFPNQPGKHSLSSLLLAAPIGGKVNKEVTKKLYYIYI